MSGFFSDQNQRNVIVESRGYLLTKWRNESNPRVGLYISKSLEASDRGSEAQTSTIYTYQKV